MLASNSKNTPAPSSKRLPTEATSGPDSVFHVKRDERYTWERVGENVRALRERRGLMQKQAAAHIGSSDHRYNKCEKGTYPFRLEELNALFELLDAYPGWPWLTAQEMIDSVREMLAKPLIAAEPVAKARPSSGASSRR